jgi:hypothetical protein
LEGSEVRNYALGISQTKRLSFRKPDSRRPLATLAHIVALRFYGAGIVAQLVGGAQRYEWMGLLHVSGLRVTRLTA